MIREREREGERERAKEKERGGRKRGSEREGRERDLGPYHGWSDVKGAVLCPGHPLSINSK